MSLPDRWRTGRVCVVMMSAVGDTVHALPVVTALKRHAPRCRITWVLQPGPASLVRGHPAVDEIVPFEKARGWRAYLEARRRLREPFDLVLGAPPYFGRGTATEASHPQAVPARITLSARHPVRDYFRQFPGLDAGPRYNNAGFWDLPIPVTKDVQIDPDDVVIYDARGYGPLKKFLQQHKVRHVLLTGYATDMCYCRTTAGYQNLAKDFNVFLVGDATLATFPANDTPRLATNAAISFAALEHLITQVSWVKYEPRKR